MKAVSAPALLSRILAVTRSRTARWAFGLLAVGVALWAVASQRAAVAAALRELDARAVTVAVVATVGNVVLAGMAWHRILADLGSRLPLVAAARIFFVGQLGKYLPGSVWPVVMQAELASDSGVPRRRTATATVVALLVAVASALLVVVAAVPFVPGVLAGRFGWVVLLVVPLLALLHPRVLSRGVDAALRMAGREPLERPTTVRGTAVATLWALGSWTCAGVQVWALAVPLGAPGTVRTAALCVAGYALAWAVGFVVVIAPAGAGAREVALAAALSPVLDRAEVLVVVLLSRAAFTAVDLTAAGVGLLLGRSARSGRGAV